MDKFTLVDFLSTLVAEFDRAEITAAALSGSFARGDAGPHSDVDLRLYSRRPLQNIDPEFLTYREDRLVSVSLHTFAGEARQLHDPASAVFAVIPLRQLRPILDREGALAGVIEEATAFDWEWISAEADVFACRTLYRQVEVVHKLLNGIVADDASRLTLPTSELVQQVSLAVAVARRLLVESDRVYIPALHVAVGETTVWTGLHKIAIGGDMLHSRISPAQRSMAALRLYRETVTMLTSLLAKQQKEVIHGAVTRINDVT